MRDKAQGIGLKIRVDGDRSYSNTRIKTGDGNKYLKTL